MQSTNRNKKQKNFEKKRKQIYTGINNCSFLAFGELFDKSTQVQITSFLAFGELLDKSISDF